jgi:hypothetical protein
MAHLKTNYQSDDSDIIPTKMNSNKLKAQPSGEGVDWKVLNNLSHMKEAASIQE